jgi:hypothetical protein
MEGKVPSEIPKDKYMGQMTKKVRSKRYQKVSKLVLDRVG